MLFTFLANTKSGYLFDEIPQTTEYKLKFVYTSTALESESKTAAVFISGINWVYFVVPVLYIQSKGHCFVQNKLIV